MKRALLAASAAVFLFSGLTGFPTVATVTPALAQTSDVLIQDGLLLPRSHKYERYNPENRSYRTVKVDAVARYAKQGTWVFDRTADVWVSHPSVGNPNPQYAASGRDSRREELLGQTEVNFKADHDVIKVGRDEGRFEKLRVVVRGAPIQLRDMKITFADDSVFDAVSQDRIVRENSEYVVDLPGHQRSIKRIDFAYRSVDRREGKATVLVYGEHGRR
jgi:hypothetical protein